MVTSTLLYIEELKIQNNFFFLMKNILYITVIDSYLQYYHNRKKKIIHKEYIYIYKSIFKK